MFGAVCAKRSIKTAKMKKPLSIIIVLLLACHCFGQENEQPKNAFTYSAGLAYNQIWLQSNMYGVTEYAVFTSPYNWGISPFFSMRKNRWDFSYGCSYMSFSRKQQYSKTRIFIDKWQEASLASTVGFRVTGERSLINVTPFLGIDLSYLINYEKIVTIGTWIGHYNDDQLAARVTDYFFTSFLGLGLLGGIGVLCPIAKQFEIGISYCLKFKILNNIRNDSNPHFQSITSPVIYHTANIGVSYRFD